VTENLQDIPFARDVALAIRAKIKEVTGLNASAGISYNKFLAKLASDHRKPNGQYVITPEMGPAFVEALPVGKFHGIGPATSAKMNRTDFIRTAIRNQLERHADVVKQSSARKSLELGLRNYSREDLEAARRAGEMLHINVLGLATIAHDVTPELARATIASVTVLGALHAGTAVKAALADRTR
jgi:hypothetical protein